MAECLREVSTKRIRRLGRAVSSCSRVRTELLKINRIT